MSKNDISKAEIKALIAEADTFLAQLPGKIVALREAWLDLPFNGICPPGWGDPIQNIVNAVTEIVDPDRTLRETPEAKRRGGIASFRTKAEWHAEQVTLGTNAKQSPEEIAVWAGKRDAAITECRERFGVEILIPERKPWQP